HPRSASKPRPMTMRADGRPSGSTVASVIAVGFRTRALASAIQPSTRASGLAGSGSGSGGVMVGTTPGSADRSRSWCAPPRLISGSPREGKARGSRGIHGRHDVAPARGRARGARRRCARRRPAARAAGAAGRRAADRGGAAVTRAIVVSIDGLAAFYWSDPRARMPTLRRLAERGAVAEGVETVFPSTTWPTHVSLLTGVSPCAHGVVADHVLNRRTGGPGGSTGGSAVDRPGPLP